MSIADARVYTRKSGSRQFVEIELAFPAGRTLAEIDATSTRIEESLASGVPGLRFRVVPVVAAGRHPVLAATQHAE